MGIHIGFSTLREVCVVNLHLYGSVSLEFSDILSLHQEGKGWMLHPQKFMTPAVFQVLFPGL